MISLCWSDLHFSNYERVEALSHLCVILIYFYVLPIHIILFLVHGVFGIFVLSIFKNIFCIKDLSFWSYCTIFVPVCHLPLDFVYGNFCHVKKNFTKIFVAKCSDIFLYCFWILTGSQKAFPIFRLKRKLLHGHLNLNVLRSQQMEFDTIRKTEN